MFDTPQEMAAISGLDVVPSFLTPDEQAALGLVIDQQPWLADLKRRVQHYGYRYNYSQRNVDAAFLGPLPAWAAPLAQRLHQENYTPTLPDQLIINEYEPGQGIASHVDCVPCFDSVILSVSLLSACVMLFTHTASQAQMPVLLEPGSLLVMRGEARYGWKHGIAPRKSDLYQGRKIVRGRRLSLTFRKVLHSVSGRTQ